MTTQVGIAKDLGYFRENQHNFDNIAEKNISFCECTLLYFIWKNVRDDIVGLVHYRRYFARKKYFCNMDGFTFKRRNYVPIKKDEVEEILKDYDIIIPKKYLLGKTSVKENYCDAHHEKDWLLTRDAIFELYPDYLDSFDKVGNGNFLYCYNMFVGKKRIINKYCEWLFDILFKLEKQIKIDNYSDYNKRVFGFIAERLFTVWIIHNSHNIKFYEYEVKQIEK
ncbi:TPA: DUF4422 domain-containing protein [Mannheimia haemolytica]